MSKIAIIDCGTNTFHLLIVTVDGSGYTVETKFKYPVKIGEDGLDRKVITEEAQERGLNALIFFKQKIDEYGAKEVKATATSAFRNAVNGAEFRDLIEEETGIHIDIIHGEREAELIYKGVKTALKIGSQPELIMDIGGGSVEFILCNNDTIFWKRSFEIGAQRLLDKFHCHDPILPEEMERCAAYIEEQLAPLIEAFKENPTNTIIGSSGTFDTVSEIYFQEYHPELSVEKEVSWEIPMKAFHHAHELFVTKSKEERLQIPGMVPMRVDMIVVASCLIDYVVKKLSIERIRVSAYALKEGVLSELITA